MSILIVGSGLTGSVIAQQYAEKTNNKVLIIEKRDHIGGNCYDYIDDNDILVSKYGAHIFHTKNTKIWNYIKQFTEWCKWEHKVVGKVDDKLVPIPVNIKTVNMLLDLNITNEEEMNEWLMKNQVKYDEELKNGEEAAKSRVGEVLYEKIFKNYTKKQWNKFPEELDAAVLQRIPVRNNYDDRYFNDEHQYLPKNGYTKLFENMLDHENITVELNTDYDTFIKTNDINIYEKIFFTGPIDQYFKELPKLEYRSINFLWETHDTEYFQENSVVNYPDSNIDYTRIVEFKHFLNQKSNKTTIVKEYSTDKGDPYYPVINKKNLDLYDKYKELANKNKNNIIFVGRLANFKYFNMVQAIENALDVFEKNICLNF